MNATQENQLAMARATAAVLTTMSGNLTLPSALTAKLDKLHEQLAAIGVLAATQALPTKGSVSSRDQILETLQAEALRLAGITRSYAAEHARRELVAKVTFSESAYTKGRLSSQPQRAQQIHDATASVLTLLTPYGVTEATLTAFQAQIVTATAALSNPRSTVAARKAATVQLPSALLDLMRLLRDQIDPLLLPYKQTNPELYARYEAARVIIDRRGGTTPAGSATPKGTKTIAATGAAVEANTPIHA